MLHCASSCQVPGRQPIPTSSRWGGRRPRELHSVSSGLPGSALAVHLPLLKKVSPLLSSFFVFH
jgi:hypothetical protein